MQCKSWSVGLSDVGVCHGIGGAAVAQIRSLHLTGVITVSMLWGR